MRAPGADIAISCSICATSRHVLPTERDLKGPGCEVAIPPVCAVWKSSVNPLSPLVMNGKFPMRLLLESLAPLTTTT